MVQYNKCLNELIHFQLTLLLKFGQSVNIKYPFFFFCKMYKSNFSVV